MSDFIEHLRGLAKLQNNVGLKVSIDTAADLIEQQQRRIDQLEMTRDAHISVIESQERDNQALAAHVERLYSTINANADIRDLWGKLIELAEQSPQTSLAEHDARIAHKAYVTGANEWKNTQEITFSIDEAVFYYTEKEFGVDDSYYCEEQHAAKISEGGK